MGTPVSEAHRQVVSRVVRGVKVTDEMLLGLLEARQKVLAPHLSSFTLDRLGDLMIGDTNITTKPLFHWSPSRYWESTLDLQGVFGWSHDGPTQHPSDMVTIRPKVGWGLLRTNSWLVVKIKHEIVCLSSSDPWKTRERVEELSTEIVDMKGLLNAEVNFRSVFLGLGRAAHHWADRREELFRYAERLAADFGAEDLIVENAIGVAG